VILLIPRSREAASRGMGHARDRGFMVLKAMRSIVREIREGALLTMRV
jgi:hypothetical protein